MNIEFNNREDWQKGIKIFLENSTVPYESEYKWPPAIYDENGNVFFEFNEYTDYVPEKRNIMDLSDEEKEKIVRLFNFNDFKELLELFNIREEAYFKAWVGIDKDNMEEEIDRALKEAFGYSLTTISEEEYNESMELNELDLEDE